MLCFCLNKISQTNPHVVIPQESVTCGGKTDPFRMTACGVDSENFSTVPPLLVFKNCFS